MNTGEILCPFCGAPWSKHAKALWDDAEAYDTHGGGTPIICIKIFCDNCGRLMYEKEGIERE
jgi:uncharacterized Zn finger protein (UPF0148 family)